MLNPAKNSEELQSLNELTNRLSSQQKRGKLDKSVKNTSKRGTTRTSPVHSPAGCPLPANSMTGERSTYDKVSISSKAAEVSANIW